MTYFAGDEQPEQGSFWNADEYREGRRYVRCQHHQASRMDCWHCLGDLHLGHPLAVQEAIETVSVQVQFLLDVVAELVQGVRGVPASWAAPDESEAA